MSENKIRAGASVFLVKDVVEAANHYRDCLGFGYDRFWGDPPGFCMVWRDQQCIMLSTANDPADIRPVSSVRSEVWDAYFWINDADGFFEELKERGANLLDEPTEQFYDVKEFTVRDLDGYVLCFGQPTD